MQTIALVDCLVLNDSELKQLTDEPNLVRAARKALELGPRVVIAKQGEYGSAMITRDGYFGLTSYPTADIVEPTGAGDSFAGGLMGYLAAQGGEADDATLRRAMAYGTACASFNVEGFGSERLYELERAEIDARVAELEAITPLLAPAASCAQRTGDGLPGPRNGGLGARTAADADRAGRVGRPAGYGIGVSRGGGEAVVGCVQHGSHLARCAAAAHRGDPRTCTPNLRARPNRGSIRPGWSGRCSSCSSRSRCR